MKYLTILLAFIFISCGAEPTKQVQSYNSPTKSITSPNGGYLITTVEHDGHLFVVTRWNGVSVLHHPDCKCGKVK
jgi:hypothetical protein